MGKFAHKSQCLPVGKYRYVRVHVDDLHYAN